MSPEITAVSETSGRPETPSTGHEDRPRAERLKELGLSDRALLRFAADTEFIIHEGERVGSA